MLDLIRRVLAFLLPILRQAALQTAADELSKAAYPTTSRRRYPAYNRYNRIAPRPRYEKIPLDEDGMSDKRFHDVLMVAFDITGPSAALAHEWLHNQMPKPGRHIARGLGDNNETVNLDSWWVANDERFDRSDTDSAVFVKKGCQEEARDLLRKHSLLD